MKRRKFMKSSFGVCAGMMMPKAVQFLDLGAMGGPGQGGKFSHRLPKTDGHYKVTSEYIEDDPIPEYTWASDEAYEAFLDMKFGIRLHWGLYSIFQQPKESWQFLDMSLAERQAYQELYKCWYPSGFDAEDWVSFFAESGAKMFSFTTKHHDGFSMYDTKARIKSRVNWLAEGGPELEPCDLAYSIMETPFGRDVTRELCEAAHQKGLKVDLYFSHPDWYDTDFRPYNYHPIQVPSASRLSRRGKDPEMSNPADRFPKSGVIIKTDPSPTEVARMLKRHRDQLEEIITKYGDVTMVCLDQWLGPTVWPKVRETLLHLRKLRPDVMYRARGIGNYGDYYTPEGFVPGNKENTDTPWFVIYPLGSSFSYDPDPANYKGSQWIIRNLVDSVAKGGNFMAGIGPDGNGVFHPRAIAQLKEVGVWLKTFGEGIYATRPRGGDAWHEGENIWYTRAKDKKTIYLFVDQVQSGALVLQTINPKQVKEIEYLGNRQPLRWSAGDANRLSIDISTLFSGEEAAASMKGIKISLKSVDEASV